MKQSKYTGLSKCGSQSWGFLAAWPWALYLTLLTFSLLSQNRDRNSHFVRLEWGWHASWVSSTVFRLQQRLRKRLFLIAALTRWPLGLHSMERGHCGFCPRHRPQGAWDLPSAAPSPCSQPVGQQGRDRDMLWKSTRSVHPRYHPWKESQALGGPLKSPQSSVLLDVIALDALEYTEGFFSS